MIMSTRQFQTKQDEINPKPRTMQKKKNETFKVKLNPRITYLNQILKSQLKTETFGFIQTNWCYEKNTDKIGQTTFQNH